MCLWKVEGSSSCPLYSLDGALMMFPPDWCRRTRNGPGQLWCAINLARVTTEVVIHRVQPIRRVELPPRRRDPNMKFCHSLIVAILHVPVSK